ncbi:hypothetical protein ABEF95_011943 [Exophiala dermatitidis]
MLPTPSTSHVSYDRIYEPAEDSYLFLDTLSSALETAWLQARFKPSSSYTSSSTLSSTTTTSLRPEQTPTPSPHRPGRTRTPKPTTPPPLVVELGPGSGVIIAFLTAHAHTIFGQSVLSLGVDVNPHACLATRTTVENALYETKTSTESNSTSNSIYLASLTGDLTTPLRPGEVDVLIFNPPYVPTDSVPDIGALRNQHQNQQTHTVPVTSVGADANTQSSLNTKVVSSSSSSSLTFEESSHLLALSYAGGIDGMQVTMRLLHQIPHILSPRGVAYILFCRGNKPEEVKSWIRSWNSDGGDGSGSGDGNGRRWTAETVGSSGKTAGWEKLEIVRICRE